MFKDKRRIDIVNGRRSFNTSNSQFLRRSNSSNLINTLPTATMNNNGSPATDVTQCHSVVTPRTQAFQKSKVSVAHLNTQSINNRNHLLQVRNLMTEKEYGILAVSWFNSPVTNAEVEIEGYKLIRLDRPKHRAGGVCVYVRRSLKSKVLKDLSRISDSGFHQLWVQVQQKKLKSFLLCVTYRTPDCPLSRFVEDLWISICKLLPMESPFW